MKQALMVAALLLECLSGPAWAQTAPPAPAAAGWETTFFETPGVALPLLQAAAATHSPGLGVFETEKKIGQQDVDIARKQVLSAVSLVGNYNYGNLTGGIVTDPSNASVFGGSSTIRHSVGVNVTLPLDRLASRRNQIQKETLRIEQAEQQRLDRAQLLQQEVIRRYQDVLLAKKLLGLQQQSYLAAQTEHDLGERQFREGQASLGELSQVNARFAQAAVAQASAANQYETSFLLLESLVGERIADVLARR
jgi:outer membrane protein TolC